MKLFLLCAIAVVPSSSAKAAVNACLILILVIGNSYKWGLTSIFLAHKPLLGYILLCLRKGAALCLIRIIEASISAEESFFLEFTTTFEASFA